MRWSVRNAALLGFALGPPFYLLRVMLAGDALPVGATAALGAAIGAGIAGALLLSLMAILDNARRSGSK
jgi:hypothetical protein